MIFNKTITVGCTVFIIVLTSLALLSQQTQATPGCAVGCEFPVILRQNVIAGKTPVGTKVEAKLVLATLVNGAVVPRDAILSGEVTVSVARSATEPSRIGIRLDSAQWKNGSSPVKVYLTAWFYPAVAGMSPQDLSYEPPDAANSKKNWNGMGTYPDPNNPVSQQKFPGREADKDTGAAASPATSISKHRVLMKNVESASNGDGSVALTSAHSNIKLDKFTTYVFAAGDLLPVK
jgi:hypothetical protein